MGTADIIILSIAAFLGAFLVFRHWQRERRRPTESWREGRGIDVTNISGKLERVRADFVLALEARPRDTCQRRGWLASARKAVGGLAYFRSRVAPNPRRTKHGAEIHAA